MRKKLTKTNLTIFLPLPVLRWHELPPLQTQIEWAVEGVADYIIAETFCYLGEALLVLETLQKYGNAKVYKCQLNFNKRYCLNKCQPDSFVLVSYNENLKGLPW